MLRLLIAIAALLVYGSLYPWAFHAAREAGNPVSALTHSWAISWNRYFFRDGALNLAIYVPFGAAAHLWLSARGVVLRWAGPVLMATLLSTSIELAQYYDATRVTSLVDVTANTLGAAVGMGLASVVARRHAGPSIRFAQPGALLLLSCWVAFMLFPLIPDLSFAHLAAKLSTFGSRALSPVVIVGQFTAWLVAARLASAALGANATKTVFPLLGLVLPVRFFILGLSSDLVTCVSFLAACVAWVVFFSRSPRHHIPLAGLTLLSIALTGLTPFHFSLRAQPFEWLPFRPLFSTNWESGFPIFLSKCFLYGSSIWLVREAGLRMRYAAAAVALFLALIEAAQVHLPSHAAEISDPLLALFLAWTLHRIARARLPKPRQVVRNSSL